MQTIKLNEGFDSLRRILKSKQIHPKSKAYVLYETAKHINGLQSKLHRLWSENIYLRKMVMGHHNAAMGTTLGTTLGTTITSPLPPNMTPALAASMATTLSPSMPANMGPTLATLAQYQHSPSLSRHRANSSVRPMISEDDDEKNIIERPETSMDSSDRCDDMMPEEESVAEEDSHTDEEEEAAEPSEPLDLSMK